MSTKAQWWQRHLERRATLKARLTAEQLKARITELDKELRSTGYTTLSENRKRARLAREIVASAAAWIELTNPEPS
jgi:hypothetical protein